MKIELVEMLETETERVLDEAKNWRPESDQYALIMEQARENFKLLIQDSKDENEAAVAVDNQIIQKEFKALELRNDQKERWIGIAKEAAKILVPTVAYLIVAKTCLQFETTGAVTSVIGRALLSKVKPEA